MTNTNRPTAIPSDAATLAASNLRVTAPRLVHVKTYGCQMNAYDSDRMTEALAAGGYEPTDTPDGADVIVLNTCHIREKAAEKVYSELGRLRKLKDARAADGKSTMIAVAGCVAQAEGEEIVRRAPVVDLVIGPQSYHRLPGLLARAQSEGRSLVDTDFPDEDKFAALPKRAKPRAPTAFLTVQEGCDKFCTFCVVPYTRGLEFSRPVADIVAEAERLVDQGVREITLLGQNVNAYHGTDEAGADTSLAKLMDRLARIDRLARLRFTTSHPHDMGDDLIAAHRDNPKLMPYLHLPFQSGSDRILSAMNRKHTGAHYLRLIERIRDARPDLALSTDIIVGFPGETDADFADTMAMVRTVTFAQAYSFKYSIRPGTPAARMDDQVPEDVKSARLQELQAELNAQQAAFNASCVGKAMPVLFEKAGRHDGQLVGRSPYLQPVHVMAPGGLIGELADVTMETASQNSLGGALATPLSAVAQ